jgi:Spy/CpxP family protein refolding chaperone
MKWAVALLVVAVCGATARPAEPDLPEGTVVKLLLLRQKSVQKELDLDADAVKKITDFTNAQAEAARKAAGMPEAARTAAFEKLAQANDKFLTDTLNAKQSKRLDQITMQFTALTQLTKPEIAKELKLTDDQVKKFKEMQTEARKALAELLRSRDPGKSQKLAKLHQETRTTILAALTEEQKAKVREMVGPPFEGEIVIEESDAPKDK